MSLVVSELTPEGLLVALLGAARPRRGGRSGAPPPARLPARLLDAEVPLFALDTYLRDQKLARAGDIAALDLTVAARTLCTQLMQGLRCGSLRTASALSLWRGLLELRTRPARLAATKLLCSVISELVRMAEEFSRGDGGGGLGGDEDAVLPARVAAQLWTSYLPGVWRDVDAHQRRLAADSISSWALASPQLFWTDAAALAIAEGLADANESVRAAWMRAARRLGTGRLRVDVLGPRVARLWARVLVAYAELDRRGRSLNRRTALELLHMFDLLPYCPQRAVARPRGDAAVQMAGVAAEATADEAPTAAAHWCCDVLRDCVAQREPPATVAAALRLAWRDSAALTPIVEGAARDKEGAALLGAALAQARPSTAWDALVEESGSRLRGDGLPPPNILLGVLVELARAVSEPRVCSLAAQLLVRPAGSTGDATPAEAAAQRWAARLLARIDRTGASSRYWSLVDSLLARGEPETGAVVEQWTHADLARGGRAVVEEPRPAVGLALAGLVNADSRHALAAAARRLIGPEWSSAGARAALGELCALLHDKIALGELCVVLRCLVRAYAALRRLDGAAEFVKIDAKPLYASLKAAVQSEAGGVEGPHRRQHQEKLQEASRWLHLLEALGAVQEPGRTSTLFPHKPVELQA